MALSTRREFLALSGGVLAARRAAAAPAPLPADVNATEDLMREHGVLRRVLLVYEEGLRRLTLGETPVEPLAAAARLIQLFIEGYHEKLEEKFVFPRFAQHATLGPLVAVLAEQHAVGRTLTAAILERTRAKPAAPKTLAASLAAFVRMYAPHAAREDTDLFPAFHVLFDEKAFDALGDRFEDEEHRLLGADGFEGAVREVADIERVLGLADLASATPSATPK
jgi:hemerythrin-like domain-containing protein